MMRQIVVPAILPAESLAELKQWLGITTATDDAMLIALLSAALDVCAEFTGLVPITSDYEEALPAPGQWRRSSSTDGWSRPVTTHCLVTNGWHRLSTRPVQVVNAVYGIAPDGTRTALASTAWQAIIDGDGAARMHVSDPAGFTRLVVNLTAGLASEWDSLPDAIRHGIVRLAAHQHRTREADGAAPLPPASVAALWRPWRQVRLV